MTIKTRQLCAQVCRTLSYVLDDGEDDLLSAVYVRNVTPHPNASRLLVHIQPWDALNPPSRETILRCLGEQKGRLRSEIAASIHRKRTPELIFELAVPRLDEVG